MLVKYYSSFVFVLSFFPAIVNMSRKNRWLDDDDDLPVSTRGANRWGDDAAEDFDPNKDYFQQVVEKKQSNMVESTYRSLQLLNESEQVGAATGEV